ncbi:MAG: cation-translocating P-type ATPase [Kofleriaceae bacterium]|nr:cation-translocating P-type ATPase [Kofleriaceae bacterium]
MASSPATGATPPGLDLGGMTGLDEATAQARLVAEGTNELPGQRPRTGLAIALEVVREPMFLMLVAAGGLYLTMGEPADAAMLLGFVVVVMAITVVQERRTERALDALRDLSSPRAAVLRDGEARRIAGREVVRGDLMVLAEGDQVAADAVVRRAIGLTVDESLLTGEAVAVRKRADAAQVALDAPGGDDLASVYAGTLVTAGQAVVEVVAIGARTQLGAIGKALAEVRTELTPLQRETRRMVRLFATIGLSACALVVVGYGVTRGGSAAAWKEGALAGIAMAMATLPEEFPVVLTVFLALGAWRISRRRVLTRRMPAIETLGAATVLCVDKTGTLTENKMTLRWLAPRAGGPALALEGAGAGGTGDELPEEVHDLLEYAILASKRDPFDPMERALQDAGARWLRDSEHLHPGWSLAREYPLEPGLLAVSHAWATGDGDEVVLASKGAPEAIAGLCRLEPAARVAMLREVEDLAGRGVRVLAVARGRVGAGTAALPAAHEALELELVGLLGFADPLRGNVPAAVAECHTAGIRVVMITGDYPATAQAIARQAGLPADMVITGRELDELSAAELAARLPGVHVFARVTPLQKLRLVEALRARGEVVAMTGDGVNDAPALRAAHIGIAMGGRGTDVARAAASMVLLDDDFASIVAAVALGRRIYANIRKAIAFIVAVHLPIIGLSMLPVLSPGWPLLLLPVHVVFLELVIDPTCTLVFEAEAGSPGLMRQPPRPADARLFAARAILPAVGQGLAVLAACVGVYLWARASYAVDAARSLTFTTLVVGFLGVIVVDRGGADGVRGALRQHNAAFRWVTLATTVMLAVVLLVPAVQHLFRFAPVPVGALALAVGAAAVTVLAIAAVAAAARARLRRATA